jgi:hypothetical protein
MEDLRSKQYTVKGQGKKQQTGVGRSAKENLHQQQPELEEDLTTFQMSIKRVTRFHTNIRMTL